MGYAYEDGTRVMETHELINKLRWTTADFCHQAADKLERVGRLENEVAKLKESLRKVTEENKLTLAVIARLKANSNADTKYRNLVKVKAVDNATKLHDYILAYFNLPDYGKRRSSGQKLVAKHIFCYLSYTHFPEAGVVPIARMLGKDHSTIIYSIKKVRTGFLKDEAEELWENYIKTTPKEYHSVMVNG